MKESKYIYMNKFDIIPKVNDGGIVNTSYITYDKQEAINYMLNEVNFIIDEDPDCNIDNFMERYEFYHRIHIISRDHIEFETSQEVYEYCQEMMPNINDKNLYDFLLSISESAWENYDYRGNLIYGQINLNIQKDPEIFITENDVKLNLSAPLFKEGDIVTRKGYPNDLYKVICCGNSNFKTDEFSIYYDGIVLIAPLKEYKNEACEWGSSFRYARSELIKV